MYPFASLPENLVAFCDRLRRQHGFRVTAREVADASRALAAVSLAEERIVRDALRPVLSHTRADADAFDGAFEAFFHPEVVRPPRVADQPPVTPSMFVTGRPGRRAADVEESGAAERESQDARPLDEVEMEARRADTDASLTLARTSYSPLEAERGSPLLVPPDPDWRGAAAAFVNRVRILRSRRWRAAARGRRFDLRRTLRRSLHTGGEPVLPRWLTRIRQRARFIVLVDGSRSMAEHAAVALRCAVALASATPGVEVFTFSTALERITYDAERAAAGERRRIPPLARAWGGGTSIGVCLDAFLSRYERLVGRDTVVIIASDGLDVGQPVLLRNAMARLHRLTAGIIWLNPLLDTAGYEPTAQGMRIARPFVSTFDWVGDATGLIRLSRVARLRA